MEMVTSHTSCASDCRRSGRAIGYRATASVSGGTSRDKVIASLASFARAWVMHYTTLVGADLADVDVGSDAGVVVSVIANVAS